MLAVDLGRFLEFLKGLGADLTVMGELLDWEHTAIGSESNLAQLGQVVEASAHPEVVGIIDGSFRAQASTLFMVLLEVGVFIIDVQRRHDALGNNARPA